MVFHMPPTELITNRVSLRLITEVDYQNIHHLLSFPEVDRYNTLGIPATIAETIKINEPFVLANRSGEKYTFGAFLKESDTFIGLICINPNRPSYKSAELWFKYLPTVWGKGIGTEVLNCILDFCFDELKFHRVEAGCAIDNIGSLKVMEKAGMKREGHRRQTLPLKSGWSDNYEYAILDIDRIPSN